MTGIFKQKTPGNIILLCILAVLIKLPAFFHETAYILKDSDAPLYTGLITLLKGFSDSPFWQSLMAFIINLVIATTLNTFLNKERYMLRPNFLAGMSYLLISSFLPSFNLLSSNLVASMLLLRAFAFYYKSHYSRNHIFNASLLIGLASLFFFPAVIFIVWACMALAVLRPFRLSEWFVLLLGITTPYYFYAIYLFLSDQWRVPDYFFHLSFLSSTVRYGIWHALSLFFLLAPLLAGLFYVQVNASKMMPQVRKGWYLMLGYLLISMVIALFDIENSSENMILSLVPIAAFHGYGYLNAELRFYAKITFWLTVAFIISAQVYSQLW